MLSLTSMAILMALLGYTSASPVSVLNSTAFQFLRSEVEITKGLSDSRSYRYVTLKNGLRVLLISDPHTTRAAASMVVGNGYFSDPKQFPGLAHFLEHMLFLGSKKYPKEGQYAACLGRHSGRENAYTSKEHTNFFFSVNSHSLYKCIDRFAEFFVAPKLSSDAIGREMNAVNSEHSKNLQTDAWRMQAIKEFLARPDNRYHKFGTGTIGTLKHVKREDLHKFWSSHYHAGNMRLVLLGRDSLDVMQTKITPVFSKVPRSPSKTNEILTDLKADVTEKPPLVYGKNIMHSVIRFQTVMDIKPLILSWTLPPQLSHYRRKSVDYVTALVSDGGDGSLIASLRKKGWATDIDCGADSVNKEFEQFEIYLDLTDEGVKHVNDIIEMAFQTVELVRKHGVQEWRYNELKKISDLAFNYKGKSRAMDYVKHLARGFLNVEPKDVLYHEYMFAKYDPKHIHYILDLLTPERAMILLGGKHQKVKYTKKEPWYGINFEIEKIPTKVEESFEKPTALVSLSLPEKNIFVPEDLTIKELCFIQKKEGKPAFMNAAEPFVLDEISEPSTRIWFRQDDTFKLPHGKLNAKFWSPIVHSDARSEALSLMYTHLFERSLRTYMDAPRSVGYHAYVFSTGSGIELHLYGYNDKMATFAEGIFKKMGDASFLQVTPDNLNSFEVVKQTLLESLNNKKFSKPYRYIYSIVRSLLHPDHFHPHALKKHLVAFELKDVISFEKRLRSNLQLEMFLHGNFVPKDAKQMSKIILKNFPFKTDVISFAEDDFRKGHMGVHHSRVVELPDGLTEVVTSHPNPNEKNNVVYTMLQLGEGTDEDAIYGALVGRILKQEIYHNLRTKQQLGYIVWSRDSVDYINSKNVNNLWMLVMSNHKTTAELQSRMMGLFPRLEKFVNKITRSSYGEENPRFLRYKRSLMRHLTRNFTSLHRQNRHMWGQISSESLDFDRNARLTTLLSAGHITAKGLRKFFQRYMDARSLSVQLQGHIKKGAPVEASYRTSPFMSPQIMNYEMESDNNHRVRAMREDNSELWDEKTTVPIEQLNSRFTIELPLFDLPNMKTPPACSDHSP